MGYDGATALTDLIEQKWSTARQKLELSAERRIEPPGG